MCGRASLDAHQAARQTGEETRHLRALEFSSHNHPAVGVDAVDLKHSLSEIEAIVVTCMAGGSSQCGVSNDDHARHSMPFRRVVHPINLRAIKADFVPKVLMKMTIPPGPPTVGATLPGQRGGRNGLGHWLLRHASPTGGEKYVAFCDIRLARGPDLKDTSGAAVRSERTASPRYDRRTTTQSGDAVSTQHERK